MGKKTKTLAVIDCAYFKKLRSQYLKRDISPSVWFFLAAVLDFFSLRVVDWPMGERLTSELAQRAEHG